ncbi:Thiazole synthase [Bienertia sinuspersici]
MESTPIARQKVATNPSSKAKTGKRSTSKHNPSDSKSKKMVHASAKDKRKEVDINYYDIDFNGDAKFKEKYEMLFRRGVVATKYCDIDALKTLRIEEDVRWLFDNIGLGNLLTTKTPTSMRATLEFRSSLKVHMFPNPSSGESSITFDYSMRTYLDLGEELWRTISVELDYDSKRSSVTSIRHPALRYVFKVFSNTIFGRQEGSKVRKDEIFMCITCFMLLRLTREPFSYTNYKALPTMSIQEEKLCKEDLSPEFPPSWFKKKDGTTLWRIQNDEDEMPSHEQMTLRNIANWSFNYSSTSVHVPLLPSHLCQPRLLLMMVTPLLLRRPYHLVH